MKEDPEPNYDISAEDEMKPRLADIGRSDDDYGRGSTTDAREAKPE